MRRITQAAKTLVVAAMTVVLCSAHATFPGENGVFVYTAADGRIKKRSPDGKTVTVIAPEGYHAKVSPNGRKVAYVAGATNRLFVMNIDGTNPVQIAEGFAYPAWSPDGKRLVASHAEGIFVMGADGAGLTKLTSTVPGFAVDGLDWSRLDQILVSDGPGSSTWVFNLSDNMIRRYDGWSRASWAPDGLAFAASPSCCNPGFPSEINTIDGSVRRSLRTFAPVYGSRPVLSPDGNFYLEDYVVEIDLEMYRFPADDAGMKMEPVHARSRAHWSRVPKAVMFAKKGGAAQLFNAEFHAEQVAMATMPDDGAYLSYTLKQAVAVGPDGKVYHAALDLNLSWTQWNLVPGVAGSGSGVRARKVAIASARNGSTQVVIVGEDNQVYHAQRYANGSWSGFSPLWFLARDVAIAIGGGSATSDGEAQVVANTRDNGTLFHRARRADGSWTPFLQVPGGAINTKEVSLAIAPNGDAYTVVTIDGIDSLRRQVRWANGNWDVFVPVGYVLPNATDVALSIDPATSSALLAFTDPQGLAYYQKRVGDLRQQATWTSPTSNTVVLSTGSRAIAITGSIAQPDVMVIQAQP